MNRLELIKWIKGETTKLEEKLGSGSDDLFLTYLRHYKNVFKLAWTQFKRGQKLGQLDK